MATKEVQRYVQALMSGFGIMKKTQLFKETIKLIENIKILMQEHKIRLKENYSFCSQELLNNLFKHSYTKIEFVQKDLEIPRPTATLYWNMLAKDGLLDFLRK